VAEDARVMVRGELNWHGYVVRCSECGFTDGWQLSAFEDILSDGHVSGDFAQARCLECRQVTEHPLFYPGMVRALFAAARGGSLTSADAVRVLDGIRWRPHGSHFQYPEDEAPFSSLDDYLLHGVVLFLPWEEPEQQFGTRPAADPWWVWRQHWPELLTAVDGLPVPQPPPRNR